MKEIKAIIEAFNQIDRSQVQVALATVVRVEGSSYRRAGARMLVRDDGLCVGGISGGCLEGDALKKSRQAIVKGSPFLVTYDTTKDDPYQIGAALGCNGIIDVLITPVDYANSNNPLETLKRSLLQDRKLRILITVTDIQNGPTALGAGDVLIYETPDDLGAFGDSELEMNIKQRIDEQVEKGFSSIVRIELSGGRLVVLFIELLPPEISIVLMGNQYDIRPLTVLSLEMGWNVTIVGNSLKARMRLGDLQHKTILQERLSMVAVDDYSAIVIMSHDYGTDKKNLQLALATEAGYVGMLGPKKRAKKMFLELEQDGTGLSIEQQQRIYAPAGLDIGALTPEEIALSVLAEIRAVFSARSGDHLRNRKQAIHERNTA